VSRRGGGDAGPGPLRETHDGTGNSRSFLDQETRDSRVDSAKTFTNRFAMRAERATAALLAVSALLVACVDARLPRTADQKSAMERAEEQGPFHTYYAIIKDEPKARADEDLAKKFRERLGSDSNVHVHRVSESKFVVKIMGDQALVDKIKTAVEAFPEVGQPPSPPAAPPPGHGFGQCVCAAVRFPRCDRLHMHYNSTAGCCSLAVVCSALRVPQLARARAPRQSGANETPC